MNPVLLVQLWSLPLWPIVGQFDGCRELVYDWTMDEVDWMMGPEKATPPYSKDAIKNMRQTVTYPCYFTPPPHALETWMPDLNLNVCGGVYGYWSVWALDLFVFYECPLPTEEPPRRLNSYSMGLSISEVRIPRGMHRGDKARRTRAASVAMRLSETFGIGVIGRHYSKLFPS
ncbi:hypothetical protein BJ508DRAFT_305067 [Ascobolus immersus RN42]|uniref:Uncharacterized protein n=1 Tax=Ascobolus immersus RN42 TaxID=1160509 RepID=A0A3N4IC57_ASCIM|nr:hypothetical protein BJ508DRAFT_305067 [Ascobolus immersus RN42]